MSRSASLLIALSLATLPALAHDDSHGAASPQALRLIMQDLGKHIGGAATAIAREDWAELHSLSERMARHPAIAEEDHTRIAATLGKQKAQAFHAFDHQSHVAAEALGKAAKRQDGQAAVRAFTRLQQACMACHTAFRPALLTR